MSAGRPVMIDFAARLLQDVSQARRASHQPQADANLNVGKTRERSCRDGAHWQPPLRPALSPGGRRAGPLAGTHYQPAAPRDGRGSGSARPADHRAF
jgi:hypothetical protein